MNTFQKLLLVSKTNTFVTKTEHFICLKWRLKKTVRATFTEWRSTFSYACARNYKLKYFLRLLLDLICIWVWIFCHIKVNNTIILIQMFIEKKRLRFSLKHLSNNLPERSCLSTTVIILNIVISTYNIKFLFLWYKSPWILQR